MGDVVKWLVVGLAVLMAWRWFESGISANIGPASYGGAFPGGLRVPTAGYTFMGPGLVFSFNPNSDASRGLSGSVAEYAAGV